MDEMIVCTRLLSVEHDFMAYSYAGISWEENGVRQGGLFATDDNRMALLISARDESSSSLMVFHSFVGRYIKAYLPTIVKGLELFRFHVLRERLDLIESSLEIYGDLILETVLPGEYKMQLGFEHLAGAYQTDREQLASLFTGKKFDRLLLRSDYDLLPDRNLYIPKAEILTHPGLFNEDDEIGYYEELLRQRRENDKKQWLM